MSRPLRPIWLALGTLGAIGSCRVYDESDLVGPDTTITGDFSGGRAGVGGLAGRGGRSNANGSGGTSHSSAPSGGTSTAGKPSSGGSGGTRPGSAGGAPSAGGTVGVGGALAQSGGAQSGGAPSPAGGASAGDTSDTGGASSGASGAGTRPTSGGMSSGGRSQGGAPNSGGSGGMGSGGAPKGGATSSGGKSSGGASSGGVATAGGTGGASTGGASAWPPELIDDMEKVDHFILRNDGRNGQWFPWADSEHGATVTPSPTPVMATLPAGEEGAAPGSLHALHFTLFGGGANSWGALMGVEMTQSTDNGERKFAYDASKYKGVHFWARAQGEETTVLVRLPLRDTLQAAQGACDNDTAGKGCDDHYSREVTFSTDWQEYTLLWSSFQQGDWGFQVKPFDPSQLVELQFMVPAAGNAELWVDDLSFTR